MWLDFWICSIGIWPVSPFSHQKLGGKALQSYHALTLASCVDLEKAMYLWEPLPHFHMVSSSKLTMLDC